jgi:hypothetical protein
MSHHIKGETKDKKPMPDKDTSGAAMKGKPAAGSKGGAKKA